MEEVKELLSLGKVDEASSKLSNLLIEDDLLIPATEKQQANRLLGHLLKDSDYVDKVVADGWQDRLGSKYLLENVKRLAHFLETNSATSFVIESDKAEQLFLMLLESSKFAIHPYMKRIVLQKQVKIPFNLVKVKASSHEFLSLIKDSSFITLFLHNHDFYDIEWFLSQDYRNLVSDVSTMHFQGILLHIMKGIDRNENVSRSLLENLEPLFDIGSDPKSSFASNYLACLLKRLIGSKEGVKALNILKQAFLKKCRKMFESGYLDEHERCLILLQVSLQIDSMEELAKPLFSDLDVLTRILGDETLLFEPKNIQLQSLKLINLCLMDSKYRQVIATLFSKAANYLQQFCDSREEEISIIATIIQTKLLLTSSNSKAKDKDLEETAKSLISCFLKHPTSAWLDDYLIESLSVISLNANCKQLLSQDKAFWKSFSDFLLASAAAAANRNDDVTITSNSILYGYSSFVLNLVQFVKPLSEEQEQMKKLHKFAQNNIDNEIHNNPSQGHPFDLDEAVEERITNLVKEMNILGFIIKPIIKLNNRNSGSNFMVNHCLLESLAAISRVPFIRNLVVQEIGMTAILKLSNDNRKDQDLELAGVIVARIAITCDPNIAFSQSMLLNLIGPLMRLCELSENELYQFEALLGLTNFASTGENACKGIAGISCKGISTLEYLQLSENKMIRRAATECICNLCTLEHVIRYYEEKPDRTQILFAFIGCNEDDEIDNQIVDNEDEILCCAASGAIAMLSSSSTLCNYWLLTRDYLDRILSLVSSSRNPNLNHRGLYILNSIMMTLNPNSNSNSNNKTVLKIKQNITKFISKKANGTKDPTILSLALSIIN